jgi:hypothetical protein
MPIGFKVDHERRLVYSWGVERFTDDDVFAYQRNVWSRADVQGYDELVDMTDVKEIAVPSGERVRDLAKLSVTMDAPRESKFAIVAPSDFAFGLGRMYEAYRGLEQGSKKQVQVFRSLEDALIFLGLDRDPPSRI